MGFGSIGSSLGGLGGQNIANIAAVGLPFLGSNQQVQFIVNPGGTVLSLDCSLKENHMKEAVPTEFEVENGTTISDHLIAKPVKLDISGVISDTPISLLSTALTTVTTAFLPSFGVIGAAAGTAILGALVGSKSPSINAYQQLIAFIQNKQPVDVVTTLTRYSNMYIVSASFPRDPQTGQALYMDLKLQQLILVSPQTVNIQIFKSSDIAASEAHLGKQEPESSALKAFKKGAAIPASVGSSLGI